MFIKFGVSNSCMSVKLLKKCHAETDKEISTNKPERLYRKVAETFYSDSKIEQLPFKQYKISEILPSPPFTHPHTHGGKKNLKYPTTNPIPNRNKKHSLVKSLDHIQPNSRLLSHLIFLIPSYISELLKISPKVFIQSMPACFSLSLCLPPCP